MTCAKCDDSAAYDDGGRRGLCRACYREALTHDAPPIRLDPAPLERLLRGVVLARVLDGALRRAWQRARRRGWVSEEHADRIARAIGLTVEDVYGWDLGTTSGTGEPA